MHARPDALRASGLEAEDPIAECAQRGGGVQFMMPLRTDEVTE
ncbi:MAG TPA: hypothetical protein VIK58_18865 [Caldimonas sp.]